MCVRTGRSFEEGQLVRIGVSSPDGDVEATARVAWSCSKRNTPATGLHIEAFVRGREAFLSMVTRARDRLTVSTPDAAEPHPPDLAASTPRLPRSILHDDG